jgi:hypothetical protein
MYRCMIRTCKFTCGFKCIWILVCACVCMRTYVRTCTYMCVDWVVCLFILSRLILMCVHSWHFHAWIRTGTCHVSQGELEWLQPCIQVFVDCHVNVHTHIPTDTYTYFFYSSRKHTVEVHSCIDATYAVTCTYTCKHTSGIHTWHTHTHTQA